MNFFQAKLDFPSHKAKWSPLVPNQHYEESTVSKTSVPVLGTSQPHILEVGGFYTGNIILMNRIENFWFIFNLSTGCASSCFFFLNIWIKRWKLLKEKQFSSPGDACHIWKSGRLCSLFRSHHSWSHHSRSSTNCRDAQGCRKSYSTTACFLFPDNFIVTWEPEYGVSFGCYDHVFWTWRQSKWVYFFLFFKWVYS